VLSISTLETLPAREFTRLGDHQVWHHSSVELFSGWNSFARILQRDPTRFLGRGALLPDRPAVVARTKPRADWRGS